MTDVILIYSKSTILFAHLANPRIHFTLRLDLTQLSLVNVTVRLRICFVIWNVVLVHDSHAWWSNCQVFPLCSKHEWWICFFAMSFVLNLQWNCIILKLVKRTTIWNRIDWVLSLLHFRKDIVVFKCELLREWIYHSIFMQQLTWGLNQFLFINFQRFTCFHAMIHFLEI